MSTGLSRRNGKAASCEPCRKAKIRCDHQKPCSRCQHRGLAARCIYHPAPLTRPRAGAGQILDLTSTPNQWEGDHSPSNPSRASGGQLNTPASGSNGGLPLRVTWPSGAIPAYRHWQQAPQLLNTISSDAAEIENLQTVKYVVSQLRHIDFFEHLVYEYGMHAQAILVPSPIIRAIMTELRVSAESLKTDDYSNDENGSLSRLAKLVLANTSEPVQYPAEMDVATFVSLYTGNNLRLETMGLIYAVAVRAFLLGLTGEDHKREDFVHEMCTSSFTCLRLSRELTTEINDMQAFLCFEDHRRTSVTEGDATPALWRKLGEAITDIYAAGMHRESGNTKLPFFLAECRRKVFAHLYRSDKFICTLMEMPPRMIRRYCDSRLPLNLTDDELLASTSEEEARKILTLDGWNVHNTHMPTTWTRVRFMLAEMQEEILDHLYRPVDAETGIKLHDLLARSYKRWESLPEHTQYSVNCWNNGTSMPVCLMLSTVRQAFYQGLFTIYRALEPIEPECSTEILKLSMDIITVIHDIGRHLNRAIFLRYDFPYVVLCYGLPGAARLVNALLEQARSKGGYSLPVGLNRSHIIRQVSVFISHLESIYNPGDANYDVCINAAKAISRTLDDALDISAQNAANPVTGPQTPISSNNVDVNAAAFGPTMPLMLNAERNGMDLDNISSNGLDGFDFATWMKDIDWTGTGGDWSNL